MCICAYVRRPIYACIYVANKVQGTLFHGIPRSWVPNPQPAITFVTYAYNTEISQYVRRLGTQVIVIFSYAHSNGCGRLA